MEFNGILFNFKRKRNPTSCDSVDEPGEHYAKRNKPGTEKQILHNLT